MCHPHIPFRSPIGICAALGILRTFVYTMLYKFQIIGFLVALEKQKFCSLVSFCVLICRRTFVVHFFVPLCYLFLFHSILMKYIFVIRVHSRE